MISFFFFQAEDGIRDLVRSRGLGDVYKRQPIIFAQAILFLPLTAVQYLTSDPSLGTTGILQTLTDPYGFWHNFLTFVLVVGFTYIYTALIVNPQNYAEYLKRQNAFIPGIKPGEDTEEYIDTTTTRITLPGAIFLGFLTILPSFACLLYTSPSPRDRTRSRMPSSA